MEISNGTARTTPNALITASRSFFFGILIAAMGRATTLRNNYACPAQVPTPTHAQPRLPTLASSPLCARTFLLC